MQRIRSLVGSTGVIGATNSTSKSREDQFVARDPATMFQAAWRGHRVRQGKLSAVSRPRDAEMLRSRVLDLARSLDGKLWWSDPTRLEGLGQVSWDRKNAPPTAAVGFMSMVVARFPDFVLGPEAKHLDSLIKRGFNVDTLPLGEQGRWSYQTMSAWLGGSDRSTLRAAIAHKMTTAEASMNCWQFVAFLLERAGLFDQTILRARRDNSSMLSLLGAGEARDPAGNRVAPGDIVFYSEPQGRIRHVALYHSGQFPNVDVIDLDDVPRGRVRIGPVYEEYANNHLVRWMPLSRLFEQYGPVPQRKD